MLEEKIGRVLNFAWGDSGRFVRTDDPQAAYRYCVLKKCFHNIIVVNPHDN